jgi:hypothetical protein
MEVYVHSRWMRDESVFRLTRLYGAACCRRVWHRLTDGRSRAALELVEQLFDTGSPSHAVRERAWEDACRVVEERYHRDIEKYPDEPEDHPAILLSPYFYEAHEVAGHVWINHPDEPGRDEAECLALARCIFANKFRPVTLEPAWLTSTVVQLAQGIYDDRAFDRLPILADALQDAGCDADDVLAHCRGPGPHARGCWVVDLVLGKS